MLTIVMYHYVRDLPRTRYPRIKGLRTQDFDGQLDYISKHYTACGFRDVTDAIDSDRPLPPNPCVLTFDDGLMDHYLTVFPRLLARGMVGCFFPSALAATRTVVLDVHKIHFVLAAAPDPRKLVDTVFELLKPHRTEHDLPDDATLYGTFAAPGRLDPEEIVFVKRALQWGLPEVVRSQIVDELFGRSVTEDEAAFASELYMEIPQLQAMVQNGMEVGGHGADHVWMDKLTPAEQEREVSRTVDFLSEVYGHLASASSDPFELPRLDTNEVPFAGDAPVVKWTEAGAENFSEKSSAL
jgi:hypothetical protein